MFDRKKIAVRYLKSWFWFDLLSIIPFDHLILATKPNAHSLFRFAKFAKIYKIIRLIRLTKVLRLLKKNQQPIHRVSEMLRFTHGFERLVTFGFFFVIFIHIVACFFVLMATLEDDVTKTWMTKFNYEDDAQIYILAVYFVMTTTMTVGYGDIYAVTTLERVYCIILMVIGVTCFSFVSGALSSMMVELD